MVGLEAQRQFLEPASHASAGSGLGLERSADLFQRLLKLRARFVIDRVRVAELAMQVVEEIKKPLLFRNR